MPVHGVNLWHARNSADSDAMKQTKTRHASRSSETGARNGTNLITIRFGEPSAQSFLSLSCQAFAESEPAASPAPSGPDFGETTLSALPPRLTLESAA